MHGDRIDARVIMPSPMRDMQRTGLTAGCRVQVVPVPDEDSPVRGGGLMHREPASDDPHWHN